MKTHAAVEINNMPVDEPPIAVAYDLRHDKMFMISEISNTVSVIDPKYNRVVDVTEVGDFPSDIVYDSEADNMLIVGNDDVVYIVNDYGIEGNITLQKSLEELKIFPTIHPMIKYM
jgi:YVTN family beta-propeller protein